MKYLLLVILLGLIFFLLGFKRARPPADNKPSAAPKPTPPGAQDMVACAQCGLHLPGSEALPGLGGQFCSAAHRADFEAERGGSS